jgi:predicted O-methyltransferase YrrM
MKEVRGMQIFRASTTPDHQVPVAVVRRKSDWLPKIGVRDGLDVAYEPTFDFDEATLPTMGMIRELPSDGRLIRPDIAGWLRVEDALKLYEMARFSSGDVLELGTYQGLSAWILAMGVRDSGMSGRRVLTVDLFEAPSRVAQRNLEERGCAKWVDFHVGDALAAAEELLVVGRRFGFAFIDHSHEYNDMMAINDRYLPGLLPAGSFALFHDFTSPRNTDNRNAGHSSEEYGVAAACRDAFISGSFEYWGAFGACGLFRRSSL